MPSALTKHQVMLRERMLRDGAWLVAHQLIEGYTEARPYARPHWPPTSHFSNDCSGTVKLLFEWAGVPSPDGEAWGYGNTATLVAHGYHVPSLAKANPCDLVFYGNPWAGGPGGHVAMLTDQDSHGHWFVFSHGSESGPKRLPVDYRGDRVAIRRYRMPAK